MVFDTFSLRFGDDSVGSSWEDALLWSCLVWVESWETRSNFLFLEFLEFFGFVFFWFDDLLSTVSFNKTFNKTQRFGQ